MIKTALEKILKLKDWIYENQDHTTVLASYPPQHRFAAGVSTESVVNKLQDIEKELLFPESDKYIYSIKVMEPIRAFLKAYRDNHGPITDSCYYTLSHYLDDIQHYIIDIQLDKENYIHVEDAENWLQQRLMTDLDDLRMRLDIQ